MKKLFLLSVTISIILGCHTIPLPHDTRESQKEATSVPPEAQQERDVTYTFVAQIHNVYITDIHEDGLPRIYTYQFSEILNRPNNAWIVVGFDANWAVEMTILDVQGQDNIFRPGEDIVLVIHSPVLSFATPAEDLHHTSVVVDLQATIFNEHMITFYALYVHKEF